MSDICVVSENVIKVEQEEIMEDEIHEIKEETGNVCGGMNVEGATTLWLPLCDIKQGAVKNDALLQKKSPEKDQLRTQHSISKMTKRARSQNYSAEDTLKLIDEVSFHKNIVENKKTDAVSSSEKITAWEKIAEQFNAQTTVRRTAEQLRGKFDSLKKEARKYSAKQRQQRLQTGGGPCTSKSNIMLEKVLEMINISAHGLESSFDSDAIWIAEMGELSHPETEELRNNNVNPIVLHVEPDVPLSSEEEKSVPDIIWNKYTPAMLQMPIHKALQVESKAPEQQPELSADDDDEQEHLTENQVLQGTPQLPRCRLNRRRKPKLLKSTIPLSGSGKKIELWVTAKTELARESIRLLRKKHKQEQRREEELHVLKKRELELSILIKQKQLEKLDSC